MVANTEDELALLLSWNKGFSVFCIEQFCVCMTCCATHVSVPTQAGLIFSFPGYWVQLCHMPPSQDKCKLMVLLMLRRSLLLCGHMARACRSSKTPHAPSPTPPQPRPWVPHHQKKKHPGSLLSLYPLKHQQC